MKELKLNWKISQLYVTLMSDFDKTFVLALYYFFSENKIMIDKYVNFKYM